MNKAKNGDKIKKLLEERDRVKKRLQEIDALFQEEKENEEAWAGHETNVFQLADTEYQVYFDQLTLIEKELKRLGFNH